MHVAVDNTSPDLEAHTRKTTIAARMYQARGVLRLLAAVTETAPDVALPADDLAEAIWAAQELHQQAMDLMEGDIT